MRLTKLTHACVRVEDGERALAIDPGTYSEVDEALEGVDAVLVTHEHADHVDADRLLAAAAGRSSLRVWAPSSLAERLGALGDRLTTVGPGESFEAGGFAVRTFGGQHALVHPTIPVVANVGYLVAGTVFHPGDSFTVPEEPVDTLLLPLHAPWCRTAEVVDYLVAVRPRRATQVHDGFLNALGRSGSSGFVTAVGERYGVDFALLDVRGQLEL
jgi:L-ascorbate metabolism protein UlaG (beta-lactamase superfamily)